MAVFTHGGRRQTQAENARGYWISYYQPLDLFLLGGHGISCRQYQCVLGSDADTGELVQSLVLKKQTEKLALCLTGLLMLQMMEFPPACPPKVVCVYSRVWQWLHYVQAKYLDWVLKDHRNILAVLEDLPSLKPPLDHVLELLPRLQARLYSISSSSKVGCAAAWCSVLNEGMGLNVLRCQADMLGTPVVCLWLSLFYLRTIKTLVRPCLGLFYLCTTETLVCPYLSLFYLCTIETLVCPCLDLFYLCTIETLVCPCLDLFYLWTIETLVCPYLSLFYLCTVETLVCSCLDLFYLWTVENLVRPYLGLFYLCTVETLVCSCLDLFHLCTIETLVCPYLGLFYLCTVESLVCPCLGLFYLWTVETVFLCLLFCKSFCF